jgi:ADP-ribosyl-[dinitrogen reductase] hydrolase
MTTRDRFLGCLLGLAVGDAVGTTLEFKPRGSFKPITDMTGGGPFHLEPGQWTDDTSMALCLASSLVERGEFDPTDQMARYVRWKDEGYWSSNGHCFDIGNATGAALARFKRTRDPFSGSADPRSAGNGSIMRLAPVPMFFAADMAKAVHYSAESSRTTHAAAECLDACRLFGAMLVRALNGFAREEVLLGDARTFSGSPAVEAIARGDYRAKGETAISGSGYVVKSLEAALWCFDQTESYEQAVLRAANLGDDADTTAAVCGQIAGAFYGVTGIPQRWLGTLAMRGEIDALASKLFAHSGLASA